MTLDELIKPDNVLCNAQARSKKHTLEILSELLAQNNPDIANEEIFANLNTRERLGCTSPGNGVAFPHCRVAGIHGSGGALMKLSEPVDFDAPDGRPVDLVFGLMVPETIDESHHADINRIKAALDNDALIARLRAANTSSELYDALITGQLDSPLKTPQSVSG